MLTAGSGLTNVRMNVEGVNLILEKNIQCKQHNEAVGCLPQGVSPGGASLLVAVMGASNTAGRLAVGVLSGLQSVDVLLLNNVSMLGSGLVALLFPSCQTYSAYSVTAAVFGLLAGETSFRQ